MRKILIVDDDKDLALITSDTLESYGYEVKSLSGIEDTYEVLMKERFDLILLDINLPDGTGFEVCKELRKMSKVPVIFASARTSEDDKIKGLDLGGDDYLEKPYSLKELLARINALIRRTYGDEENEVYADRPSRAQVAYIDGVVSGVTNRLEELNAQISKFSIGWDITRISRLARTIMQLAIYEILYVQDVPTGVAVSEAVRLAKKYDGDDTGSFVNGILGSFARSLTAPETEAAE